MRAHELVGHRPWGARLGLPLIAVGTMLSWAAPARAQSNECPSGNPANCHPVFEGCGPAVTEVLSLDGSPLTGTVELANDATALHLTLTAPYGWFFARVRVHAGDGAVPSSPAAYAIDRTFNAVRNSLELSVPMFASCGQVSVFAEVVSLDFFGRLDDSGTMTLVGAPIPGSAAQSVGYCSSCATCCVAPGHFRTQGIAAWSARAEDHPAAAYRDAHFAAAFPSGLWIGGNNAVGLLSPLAVRDLMTSGGPARQLQQTYVDPKRDDLRNVLASQLAALVLNLGFDAVDPAYSPSGFSFGDLLVARGPYTGMRVRDFGMLVAHALGRNDGTIVEAGVLADMASTLSEINENFTDGVEAGTALACP